jgi:hypothetical protein
MRVAGNDHVHSVQRRIELQFLKVVQNVDCAAAEPYRVGVGIVFCPIAGIDVAPDRGDRRNPAEPGNNFWAADITGVDDVRHACEPLLNLGTQETVGI